MITAVSIATLCPLGVAFYARFLVALCKECRHQHICYLVCVRNQSAEHPTPGERTSDIPIPRAA
jgi:hypothetical protein